ncbi:hypothetical protein RSAG8_08641, partial [Rhizoctonia solani AG-8 WAC10335]
MSSVTEDYDPRISFFRPSLKHERYSLALLPLKRGSPVYVRATPLIGDYAFVNLEEDTKFNLSAYLGFCDDGKLEWGLSGLKTHSDTPPPCIWIREDPHTGERYLVARPGPKEEPGPKEGPVPKEKVSSEDRELNLDTYLDLVEQYDPGSGELKAKLGVKPKNSRRSIVLCFDGTSNHFSNQNTNVVKFVELLKKDDPEQQLPGVGTYTSPGFLTKYGKDLAAVWDQAMAWYLYQHVQDGYRYLMQTYRAGDQISIFGFSRGAYTARALAGMLHSVGLLPRHNLEQVEFAYNVYAKSEEIVGVAPSELPKGERFNVKLHYPPGSWSFESPPKLQSSPEFTDPRAFKRAFCIPIKIAFLGVWKRWWVVVIVPAVVRVISYNSGAFKREMLPWIEHNPSIKQFRQALALDENRGNFIPSLWDHSRTDVNNGQTVTEVWFKGGHTDIGGGANPAEQTIWDITALQGYHPASDDTGTPELRREPRLSNITLRWMHVSYLIPRPCAFYRADTGILEKRPHKAELPYLDKLIEDLDNFDILKDSWVDTASKEDGLKGWLWWTLDYLPLPKLAQPRDDQEKLPASVWSQLTWHLKEYYFPANLKYMGPPTAYRPNKFAPRVIQFYKSLTPCDKDEGENNNNDGTNQISLHASAYQHMRDTFNQKPKAPYVPYVPYAVWNWPTGKWPHITGSGDVSMRELWEEGAPMRVCFKMTSAEQTPLEPKLSWFWRKLGY